MSSDPKIQHPIDTLYDRAFQHGYEKAIADLQDIKKKMEEMIDLLNTKEDVK